MYSYSLSVSLAAPNGLDLTQKKEVIEKAVAIYNEKPMQNPKALKDFKVFPDRFTITLKSSLPLKSIGRALRTLSVILIKELKDPDFISRITPAGQLLQTRRTDDITGIESTDAQAADYRNLSDADLIKALVDYALTRRDPNSTAYRKKRAAIENIKRIACESGIVKEKK